MTLANDTLLYLAWAQTWQLAALAALVAVVVKLACRRRPHLAYLLWMLVIAKALTPPVWSSPTGLFSRATAETVPAVAAAPLHEVEARAIAPSPSPTPILDAPMLEAPLVADASPALSPVALAPVPRDSRFTLPGMLLTLWALGTAGLLMIVVWRWLSLVRLVRQTSEVVDAGSQRQFDALRAQIGPRRPVRLVFSSAPLGPAAFGLWHGTVIVPSSLVRDKTSAELTQILAHELVHLRRFDTIAGQFQLLVQILWWFHPAVWLANRQARVERERACDEEVVAELGCRPADYARLLVQVLQWRHHLTPALLWPGMRAWDVTNARLRHVLEHSHAFRRRTPAWCFLVLAVCVAVVLPGRGLQLAAAPPEPAAPAKGSGDADSEVEAPLREEDAAIAELKRLGIEVQVQSYSGGLGGSMVSRSGGRYVNVTIPPSFRPGGEPLPLADVAGLQDVNIGAIPPRGPQPTSAQLREQILAVKNLPADARLSVSFTAANVAAVDALEAIPKLESLSLVAYKDDAPLGEIGSVPLPRALRFGRLVNLRSLTWWGPFETDLARLTHLTKLEDLGLLGRMVEPALQPLAELKSLKTLNLTHNWNEEYAVLDLEFLDGIPNLASLSVNGTYMFSDAAARRVGRHGLFQRLSFDISALTDAGLRDFAAAKQLEEL